MSSYDPGKPLSPEFQKNAKDDDLRKVTRELDALGKDGRDTLEKLNQHRDSSVKAHIYNQVTATEGQRHQVILNHVIDRMGGNPAPGRQSSPLTPQQYEIAKDDASRVLAEDNARRIAKINDEARERLVAAAEKALTRLEAEPGRNRAQDRGQDRGRDDL